MSDAVDMVAACGGELVTYQPYGGTAKTFKAVVERRPTQVQSGPGGAYGVNTIEIWFPRDATNGVLTVQARKDKVSFKKSLSDAAVTEFTVNKVTEEDAGLTTGDGGMFRVEVQA